jgi:hypothetical protein
MRAHPEGRSCVCLENPVDASVPACEARSTSWGGRLEGTASEPAKCRCARPARRGTSELPNCDSLRRTPPAPLSFELVNAGCSDGPDFEVQSHRRVTIRAWIGIDLCAPERPAYTTATSAPPSARITGSAGAPTASQGRHHQLACHGRHRHLRGSGRQSQHRRPQTRRPGGTDYVEGMTTTVTAHNVRPDLAAPTPTGAGNAPEPPPSSAQYATRAPEGSPLEDYSPEWLALPATARTRLEYVAQIADFRDSNGDWPSRSGDTAEERSAARQLRDLRDEAQHPAVVERIQALLGELPAPAFRGTGTTVEDALADFEAEHGRPPRSAADTVEERNLARRVARHREQAEHRTAQLLSPLTATGRRRSPDTDRFRQRVTLLLAAKAQLGRWPRRSDTDEHQRLAFFRHKLRSPLPREHVEVLWELAPDLARWATDDRRPKDRNFEADVKGIAAWIAEHGVRPKSTDPTPYGRRLARRLSTMRKNGLTGSQATFAARHLPRMTWPTVAEAAAKRSAQ